jgi:hypothetical protein
MIWLLPLCGDFLNLRLHRFHLGQTSDHDSYELQNGDRSVLPSFLASEVYDDAWVVCFLLGQEVPSLEEDSSSK